MTRYSLRAFVLILVVSVCSSAFADLYGFVDSNGRARFTDRRQDGRYTMLQRTAAKGPGSGRPITTQPVAAEDPPAGAQRFKRIIHLAAMAARVDEALLHAVIAVESQFNPFAISPRGAVGLMQITPDMAHHYGISNLYDPTQNVRAGAFYLRDLIRLFNNNLDLAVAAYNAGQNAVLRFGRIPPYPETQSFVPRVMTLYRKYQQRI